MSKWIAISTIVVLALLAMLAGTAAAGPAGAPAPTVTSAGGEFDRLSPGNQKIARALFEAQPQPPTPTASRPLTLDEIAARKLNGQSWGQVFKDMKGEGLVREKTLGQVVSRHDHQAAAPRAISTASGKTFSARAPGHSSNGTPADATRGAGISAGHGASGGNGASHGGGNAFGAGSGGHGGGRGK
jgi:hypothetical protein